MGMTIEEEERCRFIKAVPLPLHINLGKQQGKSEQRNVELYDSHISQILPLDVKSHVLHSLCMVHCSTLQLVAVPAS